jgi:hypothetical protein
MLGGGVSVLGLRPGAEKPHPAWLAMIKPFSVGMWTIALCVQWKWLGE